MATIEPKRAQFFDKGIYNFESNYKRKLNLNGKEEYIFISNFSVRKDGCVEKLYRKIYKEHNINMFIHSEARDCNGKIVQNSKSVWVANEWDKKKWDKVNNKYDVEWRKVFGLDKLLHNRYG